MHSAHNLNKHDPLVLLQDGLREKAYLNQPTGLAVDFGGNVYVSDSGNHRIRRVNANGDVTSVAGSGAAGFANDVLLRAEFNNPQSIVVTPDGILLVADANNHRIRSVDVARGLVSTYAGAGVADYRDSAVASQAYIRSPLGLAYRKESGDLYVSDGDNRIRVVRANGAVDTVLNGAGIASFLDAVGLSATFNSPSHMTLNEDESILYIADRRNNRIRAATLSTMSVSTIAGIEAFPENGGTLASDGAVAGDVLPGSQVGVRFSHPFGIAFYLEPLNIADPAGNTSLPGRPALLVTELRSHRIRRIIIGGNVSGSPEDGLASFPYAGSYNSTQGHIDELGPASLFDAPSAVAVKPETGGEVVYIADAGNHAVRRVMREMPTRLRISVKAVDTNIYPGGGGESGYVRNRILDNYGYYSINGPPNNETTHAHGFLSYMDESHDLVFCAYPSSEYFFVFKGSIQAVVSEDGPVDAEGNVISGHTYLVWTGMAAGDERSENFRLRGGGCTDPGAANFNAWAFFDDGSCLTGTRIQFEVKAVGNWGAYQIEGPGMYYYDELAPITGSSVKEDDVHVLTFTAWPQAVYTVQLNGALNATVVDSAGQITSFTYLNYTSSNVTTQHLEAFRPAGSGCTQENFINYSPFATSEDNSCIEGRVVQIDFVSTTGTISIPDWFKYGFVEVLEPLLLGGHAAFTPVSFTSSNTTFRKVVTVVPGKYSIHAFGGAVSQVILGDTGQVLANIDGSDTTRQIDAHGFPSTLGDARAYFIVPEISIKRQVVSSEGGVVGSSQTGSVVVGTGALATPTVIGVAVEGIESSAASSLRNDGGAIGGRNTWDVVGKVFQITPHRQRFDNPVTVVIPYDEGNQPTGKGNSETVVLRASDEQGLDWRVVPGASFSAGKAYIDVDHFSLLTIVARAEVRMLMPQQGILTGGTLVTLDGIDFHGVPIPSAAGDTFCKFGEHYQKAIFVSSQDPRGFGEAVLCATPTFAKSGFTSVEIHDAGTLMSSNNGWRMLITSGSNVTGLLPASGPATGGVLITLRGTRLSAASLEWVVSHSGDSGGSGTRLPDAIGCSFGNDESSLKGFAISSAVAVCESPAAALQSGATQARIRLSDKNSDAFFVTFWYRASLVDQMKKSSSESKSAGIRQLVGNEEGGSIVDVSLVSGTMGLFGSNTGDGDGKLGSFVPTMRCSFGTISVGLRVAAGHDEEFHCVAPGRSGFRRRNLIGMHGRRRDADAFVSTDVPVFITGATGEPVAQFATFSRLPGPRPAGVIQVVGVQPIGSHDISGLVVDVAIDRDHPSYPASSIWGAAAVRCAVSGVSSPSALLSFPSSSGYNGDVISCPLAQSSRPGFVAVSTLLDGTDGPAPEDLTPVAQLLLPGVNSASFTVAMGGGPACGGSGGGSIWLSGANMIQYGVGGSWNDRSVGGFGWGTGSSLMCKFDSIGRNLLHNDEQLFGRSSVWNGKKFSHISSGESPAHFVSSALVVCETPHLMEVDQEKSVDDDDDAFDSFDDDSSGWIFSASVASGTGSVMANTSGVAFQMFPEPTTTIFSPQHGIKSGGGAVITATWKGSARFGQRAGPPQLACAFGTIAPVALVLHSTGGSDGKGFCVSPAHAPTHTWRHRKSHRVPNAGLPIWLYLPNSGRTSLLDQLHYVRVITAPLSPLVVLPSVVSASGGGTLVPVGFEPEAVQKCTFGMETSTKPQLHASIYACHSATMRGGFTVVGLTTSSKFTTGERWGKSLEVEIYTPPKANAIGMAWAPSSGGTLHTMTGTNLGSSLGHGMLPPLFCIIGFHASNAVVLSSVLARCEAPPLYAALGVDGNSESDDTFDYIVLSRPKSISSTRHAQVTVGRTGDASSPTGLTLQFVLGSRVLSVFPESAAAHEGGTVVAVNGHNFGEGASSCAQCAFGTITVSAAIRNSTRVECVAPSHAEATVAFSFTSGAQRLLGALDHLQFSFV